MHWQAEPFAEAKFVFPVAGVAYDVIVDLRPDSPGLGQWQSFELSSKEPRGLYIPPGFAHGFQTITDNTILLYLMGADFNPDASRGIRWNDPAIGISWPLEVTQISSKDQSWPDYVALEGEK